jgi:hypothetical protein
MPLKASRKLPKRFSRRAGPLTRSLAKTYYGGPNRRARRRKEWFARTGRKFARLSETVLREFRLWLVIGAVLILLTIGATLLFAPFFDVREMKVRRQDPRIDPEEIQQALAPLFNQRLVLVTRGQVASMLQAEYPDIEKVEISKEYPSTLLISVYLEPVLAEVRIDDSQSTEPASGSGAVESGSGVGLYTYVTRQGYFVGSPIRLSGGPYPKLTITDWGIHPQNRTILLSPEFLQNVFLARDTLRRDFGLESQNITVYVRAQEFHIRTPKTSLWFDVRSPLTVQFQRFREFLKTLSLDQAKEYIDLRIADKIIYK